MERPIPACKCDDPYVFVSYAHSDSDIVFPEINRLTNQGFPVWWDEGISPGECWSDELGDRITDSSLFLFFVTPRAANSQNCMDEVYFALDRGKTILAVHLEETELPVRLEFRLSSRQAIIRSSVPAAEYEQKLLRSVAERLGREVTPGAAATKSVGVPSSRILWSSVAVIVLALVSTGVWLNRSERRAGSSPAEMARQETMVKDAKPVTAVSEKPSIAVLPFDNMSGDPEQEYFSDGITEDIISRLAPSSMFFVIARNSTFTN